MSLTFMINGNLQWDWRSVVGLSMGAYVIVKGAIAREWKVIPRRSSHEPFMFKPHWYHRLVLISLGAIVEILSLWSLLGRHFPGR